MGDELELINRADETDVLQKVVVEKHVFSTFKEIAKEFSEEFRNENVYQYYSRDDEEKYGVVAIKLN